LKVIFHHNRHVIYLPYLLIDEQDSIAMLSCRIEISTVGILPHQSSKIEREKTNSCKMKGGFMTVARANVVDALPLDLSTLKLTDEQFYQLCIANPEQPLELTAEGALVFMSPVGGESGKRESELGADLVFWNRRTQSGQVFSSSTVFKLPLGSKRSPDVAWVRLNRWETLTQDERDKFPPIAPDFVIELRSRTDSLSDLQQKMEEYLANGVQLGWLINPQDRQVEIYRIDRPVEVLQSPTSLSGEDILPDFTLELNQIW
jgi:Uma2 family endonuclease